ncbi:MAG: omptin family outer membrane protease [Chlamydiales bacterium]|nr:omptin family outer membrane protease [Chlamydiales bacterium]
MKLQNSIFLILILAGASLQAANPTPPRSDLIWPKTPSEPVSDPYVIDLSCYGGLVDGLTKEIVFAQTSQGRVYKLSQLDWEIRELWVIGGRAAAHFLDERLHITLDGWGKTTSSESVMVDQDWNQEFSFTTPINISWSTSHLESAYKIIGELGYDFHLINFESARFKTALLAGYQYFQLAWKDYGGFYIYGNGAYMGTLPDELGVSYSQEYSIPYFGFGFNGNWEDQIQWSCYGKISGSTFVHQKDTHHLREITFDEEIPYGVYWMAGTSFSIFFSEHINCSIKYGYEQMNEAIGTMTVYEKDKPPEKFSGSGVYHRHQTLSLGISSTF